MNNLEKEVIALTNESTANVFDSMKESEDINLFKLIKAQFKLAFRVYKIMAKWMLKNKSINARKFYDWELDVIARASEKGLLKYEF